MYTYQTCRNISGLWGDFGVVATLQCCTLVQNLFLHTFPIQLYNDQSIFLSITNTPKLYLLSEFEPLAQIHFEKTMRAATITLFALHLIGYILQTDGEAAETWSSRSKWNCWGSVVSFWLCKSNNLRPKHASHLLCFCLYFTNNLMAN